MIHCWSSLHHTLLCGAPNSHWWWYTSPWQLLTSGPHHPPTWHPSNWQPLPELVCYASPLEYAASPANHINNDLRPNGWWWCLSSAPCQPTPGGSLCLSMRDQTEYAQPPSTLWFPIHLSQQSHLQQQHGQAQWPFGPNTSAWQYNNNGKPWPSSWTTTLQEYIISLITTECFIPTRLLCCHTLQGPIMFPVHTQVPVQQPTLVILHQHPHACDYIHQIIQWVFDPVLLLPTIMNYAPHALITYVLPAQLDHPPDHQSAWTILHPAQWPIQYMSDWDGSLPIPDHVITIPTSQSYIQLQHNRCSPPPAIIQTINSFVACIAGKHDLRPP